MSYIMVDVESDGPIPGDYSMICFGAIVVEPSLSETFYARVRPVSENWVPEALAVSGFSREETLSFHDPREVMTRFALWIKDNSKGRAQFISDNNGFDWQFVNWYFHHFTGHNPFGHSSTNLGSLYKGIVKDMFKNFKHLRKTAHTHHPLDDAKGNAEALLALVESHGLKISGAFQGTRMKKSLARYSKFLSFVLRHDPSAAGLTLDEAGWVDVDLLLAASAARGFPCDLDTLHQVVATDDKQRYAFSTDGRKIRARQGHSIPVDLGLRSMQPPDILYHGTAAQFLTSIWESGLRRGPRHHVHLSADVASAMRVGRRHGTPVVLSVDARAMHDAGHSFFLSENGVWLTEKVPRVYLARVSTEDA